MTTRSVLVRSVRAISYFAVIAVVTIIASTATASAESLFSTQQPAEVHQSDGSSVNYELGTRFQTNVAGQITAIRFWKDSGETGTHTGHIWSATGQLLASTNFSNETASGWQQGALASPLTIAANTTYVVSVNTRNSFYVATTNGLGTQLVNGSLRSVVGSNGVYGGSGLFPTSSYSSTNYFRDVVFVATPTSSLSLLTVTPSNLVGGDSAIGSVLLSDPAPAGGALVALTSDNAAAAVPAGVTVPQGATTASFQVGTIAVGASTPVTITGSYYSARTATLTIAPPAVSTLSLSLTTVLGGTASSGTVTLSSAAPAGGASVILSSSDPAAVVPAAVTVAGGATTANFPVSTRGVGTQTSANISASYHGTQAATLTIDPATIAALQLNPATVVSGKPSAATVTLTGPAPPGGAVVQLSSDSAAATVSSSIVVAGGYTTAIFAVNTASVLNAASASISASYLGTQTASLQIDVAVLSTLALDPSSLAGGNSSTATVRLTGPAPPGGALVTLSNDSPIIAGVEGVHSPGGLPTGGSIDWTSLGAAYSSIPSGASGTAQGLPSVNVTVTTTTGLPMTSLTSCDFGGDCGWYGNFAMGASVLWANGTYDGSTGWWAPNGPLTLALSSPQRGIGFQIMADEVGAFTATLCAYNTDDVLLGCVPFEGNGTAVSDGSAIFAGLYDDAQEIAKVTVDAGGLLYPHDFAIGPLFITDARRPTAPTSVIIAAGADSATFLVHTAAVSTTVSVNITATYIDTLTATLTINPPVLSTISLTPVNVVGGTSLLASAVLTGVAPAGGVVVSLTTNNPVTSGIQSVNSTTGIPQDGSLVWTDLGPSFTPIPSGTVAPVADIHDLTVTVSTANGLSPMVLTNCPAIADCGWAGNFVPAAPVLWVGGNYDESGVDWISNGPMTLALNSPQRGLGFRIMADEDGPFTGTLCAYNAADTLLGCVPFNGIGAPYAGFATGIAAYVGVYDDVAEISKVTIDAGGALYPHDFAIGNLTVAAKRRMIPSSVKVQAGSTTATFPVNTDAVQVVTPIAITGNFGGERSGNFRVFPAGAPFTSNISGIVSLPGSSTGATLTLSGAANAVTIADSTGYYIFQGVVNGTYTVTPSKPGFIFSPASQNVIINDMSAVGVDFAAPTYSISGTISGGNVPSVALSGMATQTTTVSDTGSYAFTGLPNGNFTIAPSSVGFDFYPRSRNVTVNGVNSSNINFASGPAGQTFSISGTVNSLGSGAAILLRGAANMTLTASASGAYSVAGLPPGDYTIIPSKSGVVFSPAGRSVTLGPSGAIAIDFAPATFQSNFTVNAAQTFQTMDGTGVNVNVNSWNGGELRSALDLLVDVNGAKVFRVVRDPMTWVASESLIPALHNLDPATLQQVYEAPEMQEMWETIAYLNQKGIRGDHLLLNFMGWAPTWIGGGGSFGVASHITSGKESEFATMVASLVYYGRRVKNLDFTSLSPLNEPDLGNGIEGPTVGRSQYVTIIHALVTELDVMGLNDIRIVSPETSASPTAYITDTLADGTVATRVDHLTYHVYGTSDTPTVSYAPKNYWVTETAAICSTCDSGSSPPSQGEWAFARDTNRFVIDDITNGSSSALIFDAYDSFYFHHNAVGFWGLLAYNQTTGVYTPRKRFYANAQVNAFISPGSVRLGLDSSINGLTSVVAFYDAATGKTTIVGHNSGGSSVTINGQLLGLPLVVNSFAVYITNSSANLQRGTDVPVTGNAFTVTIPADTLFSLTN